MNIFKPKRNITIKIYEDSGESDSSGVRRKDATGLVAIPSETEYLPRRKKKSNFYINFYDLTEYRNDPEDPYISVLHTIIPAANEFDYEFTAGTSQMPGNQQAKRQEKENEVIANYGDEIVEKYNSAFRFEPAIWKDRYKKIVPEQNRGLLFSSDAEFADLIFLDSQEQDFSNSGLKLSETQFDENSLIAVRIPRDYLTHQDFFSSSIYSPISVFNGVSPNFYTLGQEFLCKVTGLPNYDAPSVPITLENKKNINVYLQRLIMFMRAENLLPESETNDNYYRVLNNFFSSLNNELSFDSPNRVNRLSTSQTILTADWFRTMSAHPNARELTQHIQAFIFDEQPDSTGDFVFYSNIIESFFSEITDTDTLSDAPFIAPGAPVFAPGSLLGAINQGENWFFIWVGELA